MRRRWAGCAVLAAAVLSVTACGSAMAPTAPASSASMPSSTTSDGSGTSEPPEVLSFEGADAASFTAGIYEPLDSWPDIQRTGVLEPDAAGCLTLADADGTTYPLFFPRGTTVLEDGTINVPVELVHRPVSGTPEAVTYQVGQEISGGGPTIDTQHAREGAEGIVMPEGCYASDDAVVLLLTP